MPIAITREVSRSIVRCELTHVERSPIDVALARRQHEQYRSALGHLGLDVIQLPELPDLADSVFVEDAAIVLDEIAILTRPGAVSRREEGAALAETLSRYRTLAPIEAPGTLEGGDVFRVGRRLFVGASGRTNENGTRQLAEIVRPFGYEVLPVPVLGCLHLKSACCALDGNRVLANRSWLPESGSTLPGVTILDVPPEEPHGANVIAVGSHVLLPSAHPKTAELLEREGYEVTRVDTAELAKAESGVTCSSLIFEVPGTSPRTRESSPAR